MGLILTLAVAEAVAASDGLLPATVNQEESTPPAGADPWRNFRGFKAAKGSVETGR